MNAWATIQELISTELVRFLSIALPEAGGSRWWTEYVLNQLTPPQMRALDSVSPGDLAALDLAALIRVADRNWSELALKQSRRRETRDLIRELRSARNRHAHAPAGGVPLEDTARDIDTARRLLQDLGADAAILSQVAALHRRLLLQLVEQGPSEAESGSSDGGNEGIPSTNRSATAWSNSKPEAANTPPLGRAPDESVLPEEEAHQPGDLVPEVEPVPGLRNGGWLVRHQESDGDLAAAMEGATYVGIDFGTSTSVVSVVARGANGRPEPRPLSIDQPEEYGGTITHHLVNSVIAWRRDQLLIGQDAYRLRQELFEGRNIFSSFKMRLGVDVGPTYPETELKEGHGEVVIEDARDATREFFRFLAREIASSIAKAGLPEQTRFAVTVPASFEANQRRDLMNAMQQAGIEVSASCLIDEPNAAFLSFLHIASRDGKHPELLSQMRDRAANILVYDFGAGTCDVSILEVSLANNRVTSRNRAISRFTALGGDDIDRAIAQRVLLPQLLLSAPRYDPELRDIEERLLPRLQPTAERLKLAAIKWAGDHGMATLEDLRQQGDRRFSDLPVPRFRLREHELQLPAPSVSLDELADALEPFIARYDPDVSANHVFGPVADALDKSHLSPNELDAVLFIGGSAANPIVRQAVMSHLPSSVQSIVPDDLRVHVSLGAAWHSFAFHALGFDLIHPVTPEPIFVLARGGRLETIIPASTEVPTKDPFQTTLQVQRDGQTVVELPICVSNESKLLGMLRVHAPGPAGFTRGELVSLSARITHEKLLAVEASVGDTQVDAVILNPLANRELSPAETRMLEAKQRFNRALLESSGRPPKAVVLAYAQAAMEAEAFEIAADMLAAIERMDPSENHATNICYAYGRAGRRNRSREWARRAHERQPSAVTAYNLSCSETGSKREALLEQALRLDPDHSASLIALGRLLHHRGDPRGAALLKKAMQDLNESLERGGLAKDECLSLISIAELLGDAPVAERAKARLERMTEPNAFNEENLAGLLEAAPVLSRI